MTKYVALIAGATGAIGSVLAREIGPCKEWKVYGVSRNATTDPVDGIKFVSMDMTDRQGFDGWDDSEEKLLKLLQQYQHSRILPV